MVTNLIEKHGVMPKSCFPDTVSCEASTQMNRILFSKLRQCAQELYKAVQDGADEAATNALIKEQMKTIFR